MDIVRLIKDGEALRGDSLVLTTKSSGAVCTNLVDHERIKRLNRPYLMVFEPCTPGM